MPSNFPRKSFPLWGSVEKYCRAGQPTDDNIIRRMRFAFFTTNAKRQRARAHTHARTHTHTLTHSKYVILIAFQPQKLSGDKPQCYVLLTPPV